MTTIKYGDIKYDLDEKAWILPSRQHLTLFGVVKLNEYKSLPDAEIRMKIETHSFFAKDVFIHPFCIDLLRKQFPEVKLPEGGKRYTHITHIEETRVVYRLPEHSEILKHYFE